MMSKYNFSELKPVLSNTIWTKEIICLSVWFRNFYKNPKSYDLNRSTEANS